MTALLGVLVAGWPVWRWYGLRLHDGSDEPLGLVAFGVAGIFLRGSNWMAPLSRLRLGGLAVGMACYIVAYPQLPALVRALWVIGMIALVVAPRIASLAWATLLGLSLPLVSSLQFYLGYPLRMPTTYLAAFLLRLVGIQVRAEGTTLLWAGERVIVDAPCSGIQMAWTGLLVAATLACWQGLSTRETLRAFRRAGAVVFVANVFRAAALFLMGAGIWRLPPLAHEGIGLALFAVALLFIYASISRDRSFSTVGG